MGNTNPYPHIKKYHFEIGKPHGVFYFDEENLCGLKFQKDVGVLSFVTVCCNNQTKAIINLGVYDLTDVQDICKVYHDCNKMRLNLITNSELTHDDYSGMIHYKDVNNNVSCQHKPTVGINQHGHVCYSSELWSTY